MEEGSEEEVRWVKGRRVVRKKEVRWGKVGK